MATCCRWESRSKNSSPATEQSRDIDVSFKKAGKHTVEVQLPEDSLASDNHRYAALDISVANPVLIIDGDNGQRRRLVRLECPGRRPHDHRLLATGRESRLPDPRIARRLPLHLSAQREPAARRCHRSAGGLRAAEAGASPGFWAASSTRVFTTKSSTPRRADCSRCLWRERTNQCRDPTPTPKPPTSRLPIGRRLSTSSGKRIRSSRA